MAVTLRMLVSYEGTEISGFQRQSGARSVQADLEDAIHAVTSERVRLRAAGRTDAGVHAGGQVVAVEIEKDWPLEKWPPAMNSALQPDIRVRAALPAQQGFDPGRQAVGKAYRYLVDPARVADPLTRRFAYSHPRGLDVDAMREGAAMLTGRRDFKALQAAGSSVRTSERHVYRLNVDRDPSGLLAITVAADGFLYHMVRNIAGLLLAVGRGTLRPGDVLGLIEGRDRGALPATAPAHGLCLMRVYYPDVLDTPRLSEVLSIYAPPWMGS